MASSLAQQLQVLQQRQGLPTQKAKFKGKPSLLFDFQKAADVDAETLYEIGCQGLEELARVEPRFTTFRDSLFSQAARGFNRDHQTPEALQRADEAVHAFCALLSGHLLNPGGFKALEYLIRRYRVNEYNIDSLMLAGLPYHGTNEFVRLVQTLRLDPARGTWAWLVRMQETGAALPRETLVQRCVNDRAVLRFLLEGARSLGGSRRLGPCVRTYLSFYAVAMCEVVASAKVDEAFLSLLLPYLLAGLEGAVALDYRAATLMMLAELASRATLAPGFVKVVVSAILSHTDHHSPEQVRTSLLLLAHLAATQRSTWTTLTDRALKSLLALPDLSPELAGLAAKRVRLAPLLALIADALARRIASADVAAGTAPGVSPAAAEKALLQLAAAGQASSPSSSDPGLLLELGGVAGSLAERLLHLAASADEGAAVRLAAQRVLRALDLRYPHQLDQAINRALKPSPTTRKASEMDVDVSDSDDSSSSDEEDAGRKKKKSGSKKATKGSATAALGAEAAKSTTADEDNDATAAATAAPATASQEALFEFVKSAFAGSVHAPLQGTQGDDGQQLTVMAAVAAPAAAVRRMALQQLEAALSNPATPPEARTHLQSAVLSRLTSDEDLDVVTAALGTASAWEAAPAAPLLAALSATLTTRLGPILLGAGKLPGLKAARTAAKKALKLLAARAAAPAADAAGVGAALLHLLDYASPPRHAPKLAAAASAAAAALAQQHPLAAALASVPVATMLGDDEAEGAATPAAAGSGSGSGSAGSREDKGAARLAVHRAVVGALAKAVGASPAAAAEAVRLAEVARGSASAAAPAHLRARHLLLCALLQAATASSAPPPAAAKTPGKAGKTPAKASAAAATASSVASATAAAALVQFARGELAAAASAPAGSSSPTVPEGWEEVSGKALEPGSLPTADHLQMLATQPLETHLCLLAKAMKVGLESLPSPGSGSGSGIETGSTASLFEFLAGLQPPAVFQSHLDVLVRRQAGSASEQVQLLTSFYAAPPRCYSPAAQSAALRLQGVLASEESPAEVVAWLPYALSALGNPARPVRKAAAECLGAAAACLAGGKGAAPAVGSFLQALLTHRTSLLADAGAAAASVHHTLAALLNPSPAVAPPSTSTATKTPAKTPGKGKKAAAAAKEDASAAAGDDKAAAALKLDVATASAQAVAELLLDTLPLLPGLGPHGHATAIFIMSCLVDPSGSASSAGEIQKQRIAVPEALQQTLFSHSVMLLRELLQPFLLTQQAAASTTPAAAPAPEELQLGARLVGLYSPATLSSSDPTEATAVLTSALSSATASCDRATAAGLGPIRLAALQAVTPELYAAIPTSPKSKASSGPTARSKIHQALLSCAAGDPHDPCRPAARAALEALPLSYQVVEILLLPAIAAATAPSAAATAATDATTTPAPKSKKAKKGAATPAPAAVTPAAATASTDATASDPSLLPALDQGIMVLELLQWKEVEAVAEASVATAHVSLLQRLLEALRPSITAVVSSHGDDKDEGATATADDSAVVGPGHPRTGYAAQLVLGALSKLVGEEACASALEALRLDLVVAVAREAPDSALRNAGLQLLALLAGKLPAAVLDHVLQVLSLVNQSAAIQDDAHSQAVATTALAAVAPAWLEAGKPVAELWQAVAEALPSVPPHRRLGLLGALLGVLPADTALPVGLLALLQHAAAATATATATTPEAQEEAPPTATAPSPADWLPELAAQLALQVPPSQRLPSLARLMSLAVAAEGAKPQPHKLLPRLAVTLVTAQLKALAKSSPAATAAAGQDPDLTSAAPSVSLQAGCQEIMTQALTQLQQLHAATAPAAAATATTTTPAKTPGSKASAERKRARAVRHATESLHALLQALQGVLAPEAYLEALSSLASSPQASDTVVRRALRLFGERLETINGDLVDIEALPPKQRDARLARLAAAAMRVTTLLQPLLQPAVPGTPPRPALTRQVLLVALSSAALAFGARCPEPLAQALPSIIASMRDPHAAVRSSGLAALAAATRAVSTRLVPLLPQALPAVLEACQGACARLAPGSTTPTATAMEEDADPAEKEEGGDTPLSVSEQAAVELGAGLAALDTMAQTLAGYLSPFLPRLLSLLLAPQVLTCQAAGVGAFAADMRRRLPATLPPRLLLEPLFGQLQSAVLSGPASACALLDMVGSAAGGMDPKVAAEFHERIFLFLLRALDVRQLQPPSLAGHVHEVEAHAVQALLSLVMKLSESKFKPLFLRLLEWASARQGIVEGTSAAAPGGAASGMPNGLGRSIALFACATALAKRLRSVFVPYFKFLVDQAIQHLGGDATAAAGGAPRKKKQRKSSAGLVADADADAATTADGSSESGALAGQWLLRVQVVRALHCAFLYDQVNFLDQDKFDRLLPALVSQLEAEPPAAVAALLARQCRDAELDGTITPGKHARLADDVAGTATVAALVQMAATANNDAMWKPLHHQVLLVSRSSSPRSRLLSLEVLAQLVGRLREEYLVLLPEALPFVSELLEDVEPAVEGRVQELVAQLEEVSGEKLDEYLKV